MAGVAAPHVALGSVRSYSRISLIGNWWHVTLCALVMIVVGLKFGIVPKQIVPIGVERHGLDDAANGQTHTPNAGLPVHLVGVPRDSVETLHEVLLSYKFAVNVWG